MDPTQEKNNPSALASALAETANIDEPVLQGVLRHYPRRGISPRLMPIQPRRYSADYENMSRSAPRQRHARFEAASPLQREPVLMPPPGPRAQPQETILMNERVEEGIHFDEGEGEYATPEWDAPQQTPDERTSLLHERSRRIDHSSGHGSISLSTDGSDSRMRQSADYDDGAYDNEDRLFQKSVYMLGFSIMIITSVVFVIVVSGLTTLIARRAVPRFTVTADWPDGSEIPLKYGCLAPGGRAQSFPITWHNVPTSATNLVILFANPGSISERGYDPVHWFVTDIPVIDRDGLPFFQMPANASDDVKLMPPQARQRANVKSVSGIYFPPCPNRASSLFVMHVYAIDASPVIDDFKDARKIMSRFAGVPTAKYSGTYGTAHRNIQVVGGRNTHGGNVPKKSYKGKSKPRKEHRVFDWSNTK